MILINWILNLLLFLSLTVFSITNVFALKNIDNITQAKGHVSEGITKVINLTMDKYKLSGVQLTIDGTQLNTVSRGYANKDSKELISSNSIFQIASITKSFTSGAIIQLSNDKKINVNDKLSKWLPQYPKWKDVTIEELLNQTSGIPDYIDSSFWWWRLYFFPNKIWTATEVLNIAYKMDMSFLPNQGWHYSNSNYVLLGLIIEKVSHQNVGKFFANNFLGKLGLSNTAYFSEADANLNSRLALGYNQHQRVTHINPSWIQAGGGIISNSRDVAIWYKYFMNDILPYKNIDFVSIKDGKHIGTINSINQIGYGSSVFITTTPYGPMLFTPGLAPGYIGLVAWLPCQDISFSYVANSNPPIKGFHEFFLEHLLPLIVKDSKASSTLPYCVQNVEAEKSIEFPHF